MSQYQICVFGQADDRFDDLRSRVARAVAELGIPAEAVAFLAERDIHSRNRKMPAVGVFFGYAGATDGAHPGLAALLSDSVTVATVVSDLKRARAELPPLLEDVNALELKGDLSAQERLATLVLEGFRLLRRDRRLFISYKRDDSQSLADRLYDEFDRRGFDVFIDTRSVPPAVNFQHELWHRLSDSDVIVLIDTPNFRTSRWTKEELAQANATNIQILHLLWPRQEPDDESAFSHFYRLEDADFVAGAELGGVSTIKPNALERICEAAETLRARAMAARYRYLVDNFCDLAREAGLAPIVQPDRCVTLTLPTGEELAVVPGVGVPTADRIHEVFDTISSQRVQKCPTWLIYDNRGLLTSWLSHLDWLDSHLPVRAIRMSTAPDAVRQLVA